MKRLTYISNNDVRIKTNSVEKLARKLAEYEDLDEQGLLLRLSHRVEDCSPTEIFMLIEQKIEAVYNKAIDDFVEFASDMPVVEENGKYRPMRLKEMAEQLKKDNKLDLK